MKTPKTQFELKELMGQLSLLSEAANAAAIATAATLEGSSVTIKLTLSIDKEDKTQLNITAQVSSSIPVIPLEEEGQYDQRKMSTKKPSQVIQVIGLREENQPELFDEDEHHG
jgi:hypothetical protein